MDKKTFSLLPDKKLAEVRDFFNNHLDKVKQNSS